MDKTVIPLHLPEKLVVTGHIDLDRRILLKITRTLAKKPWLRSQNIREGAP
jgi:hypothetical protein